MNHKTLAAHTTIKAAAQGLAEVVVTGYGTVDSDGDIVDYGASRNQIAGLYGPANPKGMLDHKWEMSAAVAKTLRMFERPDGLHIEAQYNLEKQAARDAFNDLKFYGDSNQFSVGYDVKATRPPTADEKAAGCRRVITEWVVSEWSHVMLGANETTRLVSMKGRQRSGISNAAVAEYQRLLLATLVETTPGVFEHAEPKRASGIPAKAAAEFAKLRDERRAIR